MTAQPGDVVRRVPTRLGNLQVRECGSGPPLVLWHSLFVDSRTWQRLLEPLSRDHRLLVIDGPSHGGSSPAVRRFTLAECAQSAAEILDHLGVEEPVDWLGNAWGGHVGILFAAGWPERCRSLVAVGTPVHGIGRAERRRSRALVAVYRVTGAIPPLVKPVVDALLGPRMQSDDPDAVRLVSDALRSADRRGMHKAMWLMLTRPDLSEAVHAGVAPTLFIAGADDPLWLPGPARAAAGGLRHGGCAAVPGEGHVAPLLERDPALLDLLRAFWLDPDGVAARHSVRTGPERLAPT